MRKLSDDTWWVLGAATDDIVLDDPVPGTAIDDPLMLSGQASAFEGTVQVSVFERGDVDALGEGFVTGSGSGEPGPFEGEVRWENPGGGCGVVWCCSPPRAPKTTASCRPRRSPLGSSGAIDHALRTLIVSQAACIGSALKGSSPTRGEDVTRDSA